MKAYAPACLICSRGNRVVSAPQAGSARCDGSIGAAHRFGQLPV